MTSMAQVFVVLASGDVVEGLRLPMDTRASLSRCCCDGLRAAVEDEPLVAHQGHTGRVIDVDVALACESSLPIEVHELAVAAADQAIVVGREPGDIEAAPAQVGLAIGIHMSLGISPRLR